MDLNDHVEKFLDSRAFVFFMLELHHEAAGSKDIYGRVEHSLRNLPELNGELESPESDLDELEELLEFVEEKGYLDFCFSLSEDSFLINEVFSYADDAEAWTLNWQWDDPGSLYLDEAPETANALADAVAEARQFYQFSKELHNGIVRELKERDLAPLIDRLKNEPSVRPAF